MDRRTIAILSVVLISLTVAGVLINPGSFTENVLAEAVGIVLSVAIALTLVERLLRRERSHQWHNVRSHTLNAIGVCASDIAFQFELALVMTLEEVSNGSSTTRLLRCRAEIVERLDELSSVNDPERVVIKADPRAPIEWSDERPLVIVRDERTRQHVLSEDLDNASSRSLYSSVLPYMHQLRDVLTPRVLQFEQDPDLVELLVLVEKAYRDWATSVEVIEEWGAPDRYGWESAANTADALAELTRHLETVMPTGHMPVGWRPGLRRDSAS